MTTVDVVIPAYGDASRLNRLLTRLDEEANGAKDRLRVIVSDDGSPKPLADALKASDFSRLDVDVVRGPNGGPGAARNRGMAASSAEWVAFLDADTVPHLGWLGVLRSLVEAGGDVDAFEGSVSVPSEGATPFSHATQIDTDVAHGGANIIYRRESLQAIGGFSERFYDAKRGMHFREDIELYFRALDANLRVRRAPELLAEHPPLDASFVTPMKLARRYYFDALLDRQHSARFREVNLARRVGPISLRAARHGASVGHVASIILLTLGIVGGRRDARRLGALAATTSWTANAGALIWGKELRAADAFGVSVAALTTPWVYTWHYYRGVIRFRHRPKLR